MPAPRGMPAIATRVFTNRRFPHGCARQHKVQRMSSTVTKPRGRHFFANPGPTNIPDSVLRAIDRPSIDFHDPDFREVYDACFEGVKRVLRTAASAVHVHRLRPWRVGGLAHQPAVARRYHPAAGIRLFLRRMGEDGPRAEGRGAPGRRRLAPRRGYRRGEGGAGRGHRRTRSRRCAWCTTRPRPACSCRSPRCARRSTTTKHPALLLVDTISSLGSLDFRMDEWKIDCVVGGSQKGLMLPTGLSFTARLAEGHGRRTRTRSSAATTSTGR